MSLASILPPQIASMPLATGILFSNLQMHFRCWLSTSAGGPEEMLLFSTQEYGFVHLPEAYSTGSSAMPQKMNGDLLELTRAKAARVIGDATALMIAVKGLPLAYNKDLQETQEPLFTPPKLSRCCCRWWRDGWALSSLTSSACRALLQPAT